MGFAVENELLVMPKPVGLPCSEAMAEPHALAIGVRRASDPALLTCDFPIPALGQGSHLRNDLEPIKHEQRVDRGDAFFDLR